MNHLRITGTDLLTLPVIIYIVIPEEILENEFKIHVFLAAVESTVAAVVAAVLASALASALASRFKDPAQILRS